MSIDHVNLNSNNLDRTPLMSTVILFMNCIYRVQGESTWQFSFNFFSILKCGRIIRIHQAWTGDKNLFRLNISDWLSTYVISIM